VGKRFPIFIAKQRKRFSGKEEREGGDGGGKSPYRGGSWIATIKGGGTPVAPV